MAEETTTNTTGQAADTSAGDGKNTAAATPGAATQAATTEGAKGEAQAQATAGKSFTQEEVEELVKQRLEQQRRAAQTQAEDKARQERERLLAEQGDYKALLSTREQELAQAREELKAERLTNAVLQEAAAHNVVNTRALMKLVRDEVEYDETGKPTNLKKLVEQAVKDVPGLGAAPQAPQAAQEQPQGTPTVQITPTNPARTGTQVPDGKPSLFTPGLFKQ